MQNTNKKFNHKTKIAKVSFTGTRLTAYAGITGINKHLRKMKLFKAFAKLFPTVVQNATQYSNAQLSMLMVLASLCKVNRLKNIETFSADPLVMSSINSKNKISDSSLSGRFMDFGQKGARKLEGFALRQNQDFLKTQSLEVLTVDVDSTVTIVYGNQEGSAVGYNPQKQGAASYHPLLAFLSDYKLVMHTWFRSGDAYTANGTIEFIKQINAHIPENVKKVFYRCDSGFFDNTLIQEMENAGNDYLIKVKLKGLETLLNCQEWQAVENQHNKWTCEFDYTFKIKNEDNQSIHVGRTLRAIRIKNSMGFGTMGEEIFEYQYFCYCTNLIGRTTVEVHELYAKRGNCENWIEQVKNQLLAGKTLVDDFWANDIFWQLSVLAYNISIRMRLKIKRILRQEYNTFRDWFVRVPGELINSGNRLIIKLYSQYIYKTQWEEFYMII